MNKFNNKFDKMQAEFDGYIDTPEYKDDFVELDNDPTILAGIPETEVKSSGISQLDDIFKWKRAFSYLWTGTPNTGKSTVSLYACLLASVRFGFKWCVWTQEMEDAYKKGESIKYHVKDVINTLIWTLTGKSPYAHVVRKWGGELLEGEELYNATVWVNTHFKFFHAYNRTPKGLISGFTRMFENYGVDGFIIDPWKSVKQEISGRSDLWLEDVLMSFKEFSLLTNSFMNFIVHPKTLKDYTDPNNPDWYRVVNANDLNGGAAWYNSMDMITSLRRTPSDSNKTNMEWHQLKIRKQHLIGQPGAYTDMSFDIGRYRYLWSGNDPFTPNGSPLIDFS